MSMHTDARAQMSKVFWSDGEKLLVIRQACDIQAARPDLSGLPLLRLAMGVLPPARRRKVVAVTQAPWFERGMKDELKRRADETRMRDPLLDAHRAYHLEASVYFRLHEAWSKAHIEFMEEALNILDEISTALKLLNEKNGAGDIRLNRTSAGDKEEKKGGRRG